MLWVYVLFGGKMYFQDGLSIYYRVLGKLGIAKRHMTRVFRLLQMIQILLHLNQCIDWDFKVLFFSLDII